MCPQTDQTTLPAIELDSDLFLIKACKALGHPARLALVHALGCKPRCCGHLVKDLAASNKALAQSTVSQHLQQLLDAGLVHRQVRGVESYYTLNQDQLQRAALAFGALGGGQSKMTSRKKS